MKKRLNKLNYLFFIILPFIDIITSITTRFLSLPVSLGIIIKGLYSIFIVVYILLYCNNKEKKHFIYYLIFILLYCILFVITKKHLWNLNNLVKAGVSLYKYLFTGFILFAYIVIYNDKKSSKFISKIMFYTLICYTLLLIVPEITGTAFNSYADRPKEGSVGWFYAANEISALVLMLFPVYFSKLKSKLEEKKYYYLLLLIPIIYSIYIIGTKTSWFGLILISIFILIIYLIKERKNKKLLITSFILVISLFMLNGISPTTSNLNETIESSIKTTKKVSKTKTNNKIEEKELDETEEKVYTTEEKDYLKCGKTYKIKEFVENKNVRKTINILLSGRENKAYTQLKIYNNTNISNKLFGTGFIDNKNIDNCQIERYIEIDILDGLVHYGIIGLIILLIPFLYLIKNIKIKKIKKADSITLIYISTIILIIGLSFLSGHILGYPTPSIYLSLLLVLIKNKVNN